MVTMMSTIGTLICGSSSRGRITAAPTPSRIDTMINSGVSLELMNALARPPARPSFGAAALTTGSRRRRW
jgi:hypothetical protein